MKPHLWLCKGPGCLVTHCRDEVAPRRGPGAACEQDDRLGLPGRTAWGPVLVFQGCHDKTPLTRALNNRNLFSHSSGGCKSKMEVSAGVFMLRLPPWCRWPPSAVSSHRLSPCVHSPVDSSSSSRGTCHITLRPHP